MSAHAQVADIVEENHPCGAAGIGRRTEKHADHDVGAARLIDNGRAEGVEPLAKALAPLGQRANAQIGAAGNDHASRLSARVRVDHLDMMNIWHSYFDGRVLRSEEHTSELQSRFDLVCRLL